jgi:hypothetical protein
MTDAVKSGILAAEPFARLAVLGAFEASFRNENWPVEDEGDPSLSPVAPYD